MLQEDSVQNSRQCCSKSLASIQTLICQASSVRTMRTFCLDSLQCPEASNYSKFHPFRRLSNTSGCPSVFDKQKDFLSKYRYRKTAATVQMTWLFRPDSILDKVNRAKDIQPSGRQSTLSGRSDLIMKIACNRSATVRTLGQHRSDAALFKKESQCYFGKPVAQLL
jgi:hypothetical protein